MIKNIALTLGLLGALAIVAPVQAATDVVTSKPVPTHALNPLQKERLNNLKRTDARVIHFRDSHHSCFNRCMWRGHSRHHCHRVCHR